MEFLLCQIKKSFTFVFSLNLIVLLLCNDNNLPDIHGSSIKHQPQFSALILVEVENKTKKSCPYGVCYVVVGGGRKQERYIVSR